MSNQAYQRDDRLPSTFRNKNTRGSQQCVDLIILIPWKLWYAELSCHSFHSAEATASCPLNVNFTTISAYLLCFDMAATRIRSQLLFDPVFLAESDRVSFQTVDQPHEVTLRRDLVCCTCGVETR